MYDDETQLTQVQSASDKELAERVRFQKFFSNSKFGKKHVAYISQLIKEAAREIYEEKALRTNKRIGDLEKELSELRHSLELFKQQSDIEDKTIKKTFEDYKGDNAKLVSAVGVILLIIIGAVGLFK